MSQAKRSYRIAVIPGDGIGQEVASAAIRVMDVAATHAGVRLRWEHHDWGSDYFRRNGRMMPTDGLELLSGADAIFLGAVGDPDISDVETLWGLLIPIRRRFEQYVNLRPVRSFPGLRGLNRQPIDMMIVRENSEGEYSTIGGRFGTGDSEFAVQESIFTRRGIARVASYASSLAASRKGHLVSATKSNGIIHTMPFWDEVVGEVAGRHGIALDSVLIDALCAAIVLHPERFDVIVASNLFGDILSDLVAAVAGSIGIAPSANLNPERNHPSMFEPVHGSAPDIAGQGIANPVGAMWAGAMMLEHLGEPEAAATIMSGFEQALRSGVSTRDLGGVATTHEFTTAVLGVISK